MKESTEILSTGGQILVADDSVVCRLVLQQQLKQLKLQSVAVSGGKAALKELARASYSLLLLDWHMPDLTGLQTTQLIRQLPDQVRSLSIIAITGDHSPQLRHSALQAGLKGILTKPISQHQLKEAIAPFIKWGIPSEEISTSLETSCASLPVLAPGRSRPSTLIELFRDLVPKELMKIEEAIALRQRAQIKQLSHKLKGSCFAIGATAMARSCEKLEAQNEELNQLFQSLSVEFERLCAALSNADSPKGSDNRGPHST